MLRNFLEERQLISSIGLGIHFRATALLKPGAPDAAPMYILDSTAPVVAKGVSEPVAKNSVDVVESLLTLWQESEIVSIQEPLKETDIAALKLLKKVIVHWTV